MKYTFKTKWDINTKGVDPGKVAKELAAINKDGKDNLNPHLVLDYARDENTELHKMFEWDEGEAAEKWRLHQARKITRSIHIIKDEKKPGVMDPIYVKISDERYKPTEIVVQSADLYIDAVNYLQNKIQQVENALNDLKRAARATKRDNQEVMAKINLAMIAFQNASRAVEALK